MNKRLKKLATRWDRLRYSLPYGMWTCADGREVLFNRDYIPIWQRRPGMIAEKVDPGEYVQFVRQQWLFGDGAGGGWGALWGPTKRAAEARIPVERALVDFLTGEPVRGFVDD